MGGQAKLFSRIALNIEDQHKNDWNSFEKLWTAFSYPLAALAL